MLPDDERKSLLRSLNYAQYDDVMNVLTSMPRVTMEIRWEGKNFGVKIFIENYAKNCLFFFSSVQDDGR